MGTRTYVGVTIGPIYKTIQLAKRTGELWGSSYIFSFIMKKIIEKTLKKHKNDNIQDRFIVPYVGEGYTDNIFKEQHKAGIFHDRFIFQSKENENEFESVNRIIDDVKKMVAEQVYKDISSYYERIVKFSSEENDKYKLKEKLNEIFKRGDIENNIKDYIREYFQIYSVEVEINEADIKNNKTNIIFEVSRYLDAVELNEKFSNSEKDNYLSYFFKNEIMKKSFLAIDAFGEGITKNIDAEEVQEKFYKNYPSLANIAMRDLGVEADDDSSEDKLRKSHKQERRKVHNYVAIVQVDGDGIGKIIEKLQQNHENEKETFKGFSKQLYNHAKDSVNIIENYGGFTLYAGGDDLLFIAPVINRKSKNDCKNIFDLIDIVSEKFETGFEKYLKENLKNDEDSIKKPTLSFGMSIIHYKYPLYEALKDTGSLLFNNAKNYKHFSKEDKETEVKAIEKDAISFKVIKHSGQWYGLTLNKKSKSYENFKEILKKEMKILGKGENEREGLINNLRAISNKLWVEDSILNCVGDSLEMLQNYFHNNFNEDYHEKGEVKECITNIQNLIFEIYYECKLEIENNEDETEIRELNERFKDKKVKEKIYTYLKFIRFLGEKEKDDEE
ncbi:type III-B CRISPR-associated protein Cas10/Cmr2 [Clostridium brassicae]|uniref:Type III-B CRISPR-associated protein Cas10/Cmr2 n=1 Tax=Clostridium brassicae TaxID=2999072 RepID=A0ABT4D9P5_9CLOT|nr:type III-B CRISPR-associated protein Cas10/Cmr2 [Clostridium brassicae]MCY6958368.1 type III-B CRISPR-associated protein Cas10/Cmr2 [Clostridium brassicae]